jgi:hypothetical protein
MTTASEQALQGLRDLSTLKWYVIPLLAIVFYIYTLEIQKARKSGNWNAIFAGVTLFGIDFFHETWNGWIFTCTQYSAFWTTPGETALRTMVGWNIEIMFMFSIAGIIYYNTITDKNRARILGLPEGWFWVIAYAAFCVFIECLLNSGGHLVWEYPWWRLSFGGVWLIFCAYFSLFAGALLVTRLETVKKKIAAITTLYGITVLMNLIAFGILGWVY